MVSSPPPLCRLELLQDPRSDTLFVFINKDHTMLRVLSYDGSGFWLMTKRLSKGKFRGWPRDGQAISTVTACHLSQLLKGGDMQPLAKVA